MTLAIDASTPAVKVFLVGTSTGASNSFSPPAGSVILLGIVAAGAATATQSVTGVTDSLGSHLGWTFIVRENQSAAGALVGTAEWWYAPCPSSQTAMTVTGTLAISTSTSAGANAGIIMPIVLTGAAATQIGATAVAFDKTVGSAPSVTVTAQSPGSLLFGAFVNGITAVAGTAAAGQSTTINGNATATLDATDGFAYWLQSQTAATVGPGNVPINDTAPSNVFWNGAVVEVLGQLPADHAPTNVTVQMPARYQ